MKRFIKSKKGSNTFEAVVITPLWIIIIIAISIFLAGISEQRKVNNYAGVVAQEIMFSDYNSFEDQMNNGCYESRFADNFPGAVISITGFQVNGTNYSYAGNEEMLKSAWSSTANVFLLFQIQMQTKFYNNAFTLQMGDYRWSYAKEFVYCSGVATLC